MIKQILFYSICLVLFLNSAEGQNKALHFDGDDDEVRMIHENNFDIGNTFTVEAWINATEWRPEQWQGSIVGNDRQGPDSGFAFRCGKNGTLSFVMSVGNVWNEVATGPIMEAQVWNHVAAVIDNGSMTLFVNGEEKANASYSGSYSSSAPLGLKIGASGDFPGRTFYGVIDEVRVWNITKTGAELFANSSEQLTGNEAGLIAYLPLDEGTGFTTANLVNASNPGTLVNMMENDWVGGAELSGVDLGVTDILGPDLINVFDRPVEVVAALKNFGNEEITLFDVEVLVDGQVEFTETLEETIPSGGKYIYSSSKFINAVNKQDAIVAVRTVHPEDANNINDVKSLSFASLENSRITLFDKETHNFGTAGQTQVKDVILPYDMQNYHQIIMHIDLDCPSGGCDPWDQPAKISVVNDGRDTINLNLTYRYGEDLVGT